MADADRLSCALTLILRQTAIGPRRPMQIGFFMPPRLPCARQPSAIQKADADRLCVLQIDFLESRSARCLPPVERPGGLNLTLFIFHTQGSRGAHHLPGWFRSNQVARPRRSNSHARQGRVSENLWTPPSQRDDRVRLGPRVPGCQARPPSLLV
jgi:hypothetical protein